VADEFAVAAAGLIERAQKTRGLVVDAGGRARLRVDPGSAIFGEAQRVGSVPG
jgi:hypothetical protein